MAEANENEFLDNIEEAMAEEYAAEEAEIDDEALQLDELDAERDQYSGPRKTGARPKTMVDPSSPATCCLYTTI